MKKESNPSNTAREYFQKGINALEKKNYDYAIEMLLQVVQENPFFFEARHELHRAEYEKHSNQPPSLVSLILTKVNNLIPLMMAIYYEGTKNHEKAIAFYEDLLRYDLCNKRYLNKIYSLALKCGWHDVAIVALESLYILNKSNPEIAQNLGRLYRDKEDVQKASFYFKRALEIDPHNQKLSKSLKDLEALHTIQSGKWDQTSGYREKLRDDDQAQSLEKANIMIDNEGVSQEELASRKAAVDQNPDDLTKWLELIDFYIDSDLLNNAHETITRAREKFPDAAEIKDKVSLYNKHFYLANINTLKDSLKEDPDNATLQQKLKELQISLAKTNVTQLQKKTQLYPNDLSLKFELGLAYFDLNNFDEAITEFQQAIKDPALSVRALNKLGLSFHAKSMYDLAILQFNKALEKVPGMNQTSKDIIYNLGISLEAMGKRDDALTQYKKIYEADISYRDIAKKIEGFYK